MNRCNREVSSVRVHCIATRRITACFHGVGEVDVTKRLVQKTSQCFPEGSPDVSYTLTFS